MKLLYRFMIVITLAVVVILCVDGNQSIRIVHVSELISDDKDFITSGNSLTCCVYGNCSCSSLDRALANLTSNVLINITTDVTLSSLIEVSYVKNVIIIGHNHPTIYCKHFGGIHFNFCHKCVIQGITWKGCGIKNINNDTEPGIKFMNFSNITIENCSFQQSVGQAVVLLESSGDININHCKFVNNTHYMGHGAAVHYSSENSLSHFAFKVSNCIFSRNKMMSLVYLEGRFKTTLVNSTFSNNHGTSVYAINHKVYLIGKVLFQNNTAGTGTGIYIRDYSAVIFDENSNVMFIGNSATNHFRGGAAVFLSKSICLFDQNSIVTFTNHKDVSGTIYSADRSNVTFRGTCRVTFSHNTAGGRGDGAAIKSIDSSHVTFTGNSKVTFNSNVGLYYSCGGISSRGYSHITFKGNSTTTFYNNTSDLHGAAICFDRLISFEGNSTTTFINNDAVESGGVVICIGLCDISFKGNSKTVFSDNTAYNGVIIDVTFYPTEVHEGNIIIGGNSMTVFSNNVGEAIVSSVFDKYIHVNHGLLFNENSTTKFINNTGRAIRGDYITFEGNSTITFESNDGGAILSEHSLSFKGISSTVFSNNNGEYGGAILAFGQCNVTFDEYSSITFNNNNAIVGEAVYSKGNIITKGHSSVSFNGRKARWCNNICLSYSGHNDILIESDGTVWCSNPETFTCLSEKCECKHFEDIVDEAVDGHINILDEVVLLSSSKKINTIESITATVQIIGYNNATVICINGGGLKVWCDFEVIIEGITWIGCGTSNGANEEDESGVITFLSYGMPANVAIKNCAFWHSMGRVVSLSESHSSVSSDVHITDCQFVNNNRYSEHGDIAIYYRRNLHFAKIKVFIIRNCYFDSNKGGKSVILLENDGAKLQQVPVYLSDSTFHNNQGASIYLSNYFALHINENVIFQNNNGAGIYISGHSNITFAENSYTKFINNSIEHNGAAIFLNDHSSVLFENNSIVTFNDNKAINGTIYAKTSCNVTFSGTCQVTFSGNSATHHGSAICSTDNSYVKFTGNATVTFDNNVVSSNDKKLQLGGTIFSENTGYISFEENSSTTFNNNIADFGAAMFSIHNATVICKDRSRIRINSNAAHYCGVLTSAYFSSIYFTDNTEVIFNTNTVLYLLNSNNGYSAGAICTFQDSTATFSGHSLVAFNSNTADRGGALISYCSDVFIEEFSTVIFKNNSALYSSGGAFVCDNSSVIIKGNSNLTFHNNKASQNGGGIYAYNLCKITFMDYSTSTFINNIARNDGGVISSQTSGLRFEGNSKVTSYDNTADNGGVFYFTNSTIEFTESSTVLMYNNKARRKGGVAYFDSNSCLLFGCTITAKFDNNMAEQNGGVFYLTKSSILFKGNSTVIFTNNKATLSGGALYFDSISDVLLSEYSNITFFHNSAFNGGAVLANVHSSIILMGNSLLLFTSNKATQSGGVGFFNSTCDFIVKENAFVTFYNNNALQGGAMYIDNKSAVLFKGNTTASFCSNLVTVGGGAIEALSDSSITFRDQTMVRFFNNSAQYGGAIFLDTTALMVNKSKTNWINFTNNTAKALGSSVYQDITELCNSSCINNRITGISNKLIITPPNEVKFDDPAMCIDIDNDTRCHSYYVQNIMLGTEIVIPVCVLDYYNQSVNSTQFFVESEPHPHYFMNGPAQVLLSCDTFGGISIMGNQHLSKPTNFSVNVTLNVNFNPEWKQVSVNLIIELSPCHLGFWQYPNSTGCECYNASDIVFCFGSSSTIRRGYWFGTVTGKPTVTFCPINYCNFTCCETSNGYYKLSPVRKDQCKSHRSGTACGSCKEGYTLSFDSVECVHVNECSIGQTILVLSLILLYWTVVIIAVFSMMHFKVGIGYLYAITYYYSMVDLLLNQTLYLSNSLDTTINIMSSIAKIIPQFLGRFCFIKNTSGIDQQFIHYMHPVAIALFLGMITVLAKRSHRLSSFISKGIIHVICCLLLLSYTSLATTSLLLTRPLTFHDIDKIYTYVSPDVEYFHGRHLAYGIVALLFTIAIVIGLPLLLGLEPFLNAKFNFVKIKPLLDQFQGCYKDKYRYFAAYYMICRLVIITFIIANSSSDFIFQYLLIAACVIIDLIHQIVRPYTSRVLNVFDGVILHFLVLVSVLPLVELFDSFNLGLVLGITFALVISPSLIFVTMSIMINKGKIKRLPGYCYTKWSQLRLRRYNAVPLDEIEESSDEDEYVNVIDDSRRINATICDVDRTEERLPDIMWCRDEFMEILNEIEDMDS